jgi:hypothetical protein
VEVSQLRLSPPPCVTERRAAVSEHGEDPVVERAPGECAGGASWRGFTPSHQVRGSEDQPCLAHHGADHEAQAGGLAGTSSGPEVREGRPDRGHALDLREHRAGQGRRGQKARRHRGLVGRRVGRANVRLYW